MSTPVKRNLHSISAAFEIPGKFLEARPSGSSGHINDTYVAIYQDGGMPVRYIHQRINHHVFTKPVEVMENIARVTGHQAKKLKAAGYEDIERRALTTVPARNGLAYHQDADGNTWRTYLFIEGARTYDSIETTAQAAQAAWAFGQFQAQLADLPGARLHETIPHFHDTPARLKAFQAVVKSDPLNRAREACREIEFILAREDWTGVLLEKHAQGLIPERITHNDTKLNNVMLDDTTLEGICVIDLDTVMPGLALYDFGDMVRTATSPRPEDERDVSLIEVRMPIFEALVDGYLGATHRILTPSERDHLAFSGKLITLEIAMRFLTDFLQGDTYFKIARPEHNLDRTRSQLRLVELLEKHEDAMNEVVCAWKPKG